MTGEHVLELVPHRGEKISSHAYKIGSWYLLTARFKISTGTLDLWLHLGVDVQIEHRLTNLLFLLFFLFFCLFVPY